MHCNVINRHRNEIMSENGEYFARVKALPHLCNKSQVINQIRQNWQCLSSLGVHYSFVSFAQAFCQHAREEEQSKLPKSDMLFNLNSNYSLPSAVHGDADKSKRMSTEALNKAIDSQASLLFSTGYQLKRRRVERKK